MMAERYPYRFREVGGGRIEVSCQACEVVAEASTSAAAVAWALQHEREASE